MGGGAKKTLTTPPKNLKRRGKGEKEGGKLEKKGNGEKSVENVIIGKM